MELRNFEKEIKSFIKKEFKKKISTNQDLISSNIIDSVNAVSLIIFLETELKIKIKKKHLNNNTFKSIKNMYKSFFS